MSAIMPTGGGGTPDEKICHQRAKAKETRIDGILANMWLAPHIESVSAWKDDDIPTHKIVEIVISTACEEKERTYLRSLPTLKTKVDMKIEEPCAGKQPKEKHEIRKAMMCPLILKYRNWK